jgi:hypothetical protein
MSLLSNIFIQIEDKPHIYRVNQLDVQGIILDVW